MDTFLLVDSGADRSLLTRSAAESMGMPIDHLPPARGEGLGGSVRLGLASVQVSLSQPGRRYEVEVPFQILFDETPDWKTLLLGREPWFRLFDIHFHLSAGRSGRFVLQRARRGGRPARMRRGPG